MDIISQIQAHVAIRKNPDKTATYVPLTYDDLKPEFAVAYQKLNPTASVSPLVVQYEGGYFKRVIPSMIAKRPTGEMVLMWGGFRNQDDWINIDPESIDWDITEHKGQAIVTAFFKGEDTVGFPAWQDAELMSVSPRQVSKRLKVLSDKAMTPTRKLAELELGNYEVSNTRSVSTRGGGTSYILTINGSDYWANSQMVDVINLGINLSNCIVEILDKYTTKAGNPAVKVAVTEKEVVA